MPAGSSKPQWGEREIRMRGHTCTPLISHLVAAPCLGFWACLGLFSPTPASFEGGVPLLLLHLPCSHSLPPNHPGPSRPPARGWNAAATPFLPICNVELIARVTLVRDEFTCSCADALKQSSQPSVHPVPLWQISRPMPRTSGSEWQFGRKSRILTSRELRLMYSR